MTRRCKDCGHVFAAREGAYGWCCPRCPVAHGDTEEVIDWRTFNWIKAVDERLGPRPESR